VHCVTINVSGDAIRDNVAELARLSAQPTTTPDTRR
jgi:hypothetical protein